MWYKTRGKLSFHPQHFGWLIDVFFTAAITVDSERFLDWGTGDNRVSLGKRDLVSVNEVARNVIDVVLADHDPAVGSIFPHTLLS